SGACRLTDIGGSSVFVFKAEDGIRDLGGGVARRGRRGSAVLRGARPARRRVAPPHAARRHARRGASALAIARDVRGLPAGTASPRRRTARDRVRRLRRLGARDQAAAQAPRRASHPAAAVGVSAMTLDEVRAGVRAARYVTTPRVETALYLALTLGKPLLAEGPAGAGKTELANVLAQMLATDLVRLQCYEGLDEARALFEWNYQKQLLRIQADRT